MNKIIFFAVFCVHFGGIFSLQCYKCQSDDDPGCAIADLEHIPLWQYEKCDDEVQFCATWIEKEVTHRGCKPENVDELDECHDDFCNFKLFPSDRTQCYQCDGKYCVTINEIFHKTKPCVNYHKEDQCYTIAIDLSTVYRGCVSDKNTTGIELCTNETLSQYCIQGPTNSQDGYDNTFGCVQCDATEPSSTHRGPRCYENQQDLRCDPILLGREPDKCFTILYPESIQRGCLKKNNNTRDCDAAGENCHVCSTFNCNSKVYRGLQCQKCDSRLDYSDCAEKPEDYVYCISDNDDEMLGCVLMDENVGGVRNAVRGCFHTMKDEKMRENCGKNSDNCKVCTGDKCNDKINYQQCIECDSSEDPDCVTLTKPLDLPVTTCHAYEDKCFQRIGGKTAHGTHRGCISHVNAPRNDIENDPNIITCAPNNCNFWPVPFNRLQCFDCDESTDERCSLTTTNLPPLQYCLKYDTNKTEQCYTKIDKITKNISRGCIIDLQFSCEGDSCQTCTRTGCNRDPKYAKSELFCINCDGNAADRNDSCIWGHYDFTAIKCENNVEFGMNEQCFMSVTKDGAVKRGCLLDWPNEQCDNESTCQKCSLSGCNNANVVKQRCVICDSIADPLCVTEGLKSQDCPKEVQVFEERWCYTLRDSNGTVHRGCYSDMNDDLKVNCRRGEEKACDLCDASGCNDKLPPNSATGEKGKFFLLIFISLLFIL